MAIEESFSSVTLLQLQPCQNLILHTSHRFCPCPTACIQSSGPTVCIQSSGPTACNQSSDPTACIQSSGVYWHAHITATRIQELHTYKVANQIIVLTFHTQRHPT